MGFKINDGGPAYPQFELVEGERDGHGDIIDAYTLSRGGMSLRDAFAIAIVQGCLAYNSGRHEHRQFIAEDVWKLADAMLAARKAPTP
jgi:hypothetical protein